MAVLDIALDIGRAGQGRESPVGTIFVIGDTGNVMDLSHQVVFNPFKGYPIKKTYNHCWKWSRASRTGKTRPERVVISEDGIVERQAGFLRALEL